MTGGYDPNGVPTPRRTTPGDPESGPVIRDDFILAAQRLHRMAFVADRAGAAPLAASLVDVSRVLRQAAQGGMTPDGQLTAEAMVRALLGQEDSTPLP